MNTPANTLFLSQSPVVEVGMLVRKSAHIVYEAFVDPAITTQYWFTSSSGRLEAGKRIRWSWEMYGVSTLVDVKVLTPDERILIDWDVEKNSNQVEWRFAKRSVDTTYVSITNSGFVGSADQIVAQALNAASGFSMVLAGVKAFLEHSIDLKLVDDRFPDQQVNFRSIASLRK